MKLIEVTRCAPNSWYKLSKQGITPDSWWWGLMSCDQWPGVRWGHQSPGQRPWPAPTNGPQLSVPSHSSISSTSVRNLKHWTLTAANGWRSKLFNKKYVSTIEQFNQLHTINTHLYVTFVLCVFRLLLIWASNLKLDDALISVLKYRFSH